MNRRADRNRFRPQLETLEDRITPTASGLTNLAGGTVSIDLAKTHVAQQALANSPVFSSQNDNTSDNDHGNSDNDNDHSQQPNLVGNALAKTHVADQALANSPVFGGGHNTSDNDNDHGNNDNDDRGGLIGEGHQNLHGFEIGFGLSRLVANLTGSSGASGNATFTSNTESGGNGLRVQVSGLKARTTYTVSSGTQTLGTFTTNAGGNGRLAVHDVSPALTDGSALTIADPSGDTVLSGTLAPSRLIATLGGTSGGDGLATYHDLAQAGNSLRVNLFGLTPGSTYSIQLDGRGIGSVTTNANGSGQLSQHDLSTPPKTGSVLTVLDSTGATVLQGSFAVPPPA